MPSLARNLRRRFLLRYQPLHSNRTAATGYAMTLLTVNASPVEDEPRLLGQQTERRADDHAEQDQGSDDVQARMPLGRDADAERRGHAADEQRDDVTRSGGVEDALGQ